MDETQGRATAVAEGLRVKGILAVLEEAAGQGLLDLPHAIERLRATSIFLSEEVVQAVLNRHRQGFG